MLLLEFTIGKPRAMAVESRGDLDHLLSEWGLLIRPTPHLKGRYDVVNKATLRVVGTIRPFEIGRLYTYGLGHGRGT